MDWRDRRAVGDLDYELISCFVLRYLENAFFTISEKVG
jgi:hypothetical protein